MNGSSFSDCYLGQWLRYPWRYLSWTTKVIRVIKNRIGWDGSTCSWILRRLEKLSLKVDCVISSALWTNLKGESTASQVTQRGRRPTLEHLPHPFILFSLWVWISVNTCNPTWNLQQQTYVSLGLPWTALLALQQLTPVKHRRFADQDGVLGGLQRGITLAFFFIRDPAVP